MWLARTERCGAPQVAPFDVGRAVPTPALADSPHIVLLMAGTNDVSQNDNLSSAP
ncbi:hypothetical protein WME75_10105 [Sorangium sp. So ce1014]|uniref:hypothetical protein n=1 Tax=Sorangium sp. So ce1014 TaxID=3133326 RepID=UPI003F63D8EF